MVKASHSDKPMRLLGRLIKAMFANFVKSEATLRFVTTAFFYSYSSQ